MPETRMPPKETREARTHDFISDSRAAFGLAYTIIIYRRDGISDLAMGVIEDFKTTPRVIYETEI